MANGLLSQIAGGINVNPGGAFLEGQAQARNQQQVEMQNQLSLLNQIEARARQQEVPKLFQRTLQGDPEAASLLAAHAPKVFGEVMNIQNRMAQQQQAQQQAAVTGFKALPQGVRTSLAQEGIAPSQFTPETLRSPQVQQRLSALPAAGQPLVQIGDIGQGPSPVETARQEARFAGIKQQETDLAKRSNTAFDDFGKSVDSSRNALPFLNAFEQSILRTGQSGPITQATIPYRSFFDELGLLTPEESARLSDQQLAQGAAKRLQLAMGEFMKGAISDNEQRIAQATVPNLSNSVEGNLMLISTLRELSNRKQQVMARVTQDFNAARQQGVVFNARESINQHRNELSQSQPLYNKQFMSQMLGNASNPSALISTWNKSPRFVRHLKTTNVFPFFPSVKTRDARAFEQNPNNRGELVIIGNRVARVE